LLDLLQRQPDAEQHRHHARDGLVPERTGNPFNGPAGRHKARAAISSSPAVPLDELLGDSDMPQVALLAEANPMDEAKRLDALPNEIPAHSKSSGDVPATWAVIEEALDVLIEAVAMVTTQSDNRIAHAKTVNATEDGVVTGSESFGHFRHRHAGVGAIHNETREPRAVSAA
jgi:hypothetical protein